LHAVTAAENPEQSQPFQESIGLEVASEGASKQNTGIRMSGNKLDFKSTCINLVSRTEKENEAIVNGERGCS